MTTDDQRSDTEKEQELPEDGGEEKPPTQPRRCTCGREVDTAFRCPELDCPWR